VFAVKGEAGVEALDRWLSWARRSRLPSFVLLAASITRHRPAIVAALQHNLSNGLVESTNTNEGSRRQLSGGVSRS
jgi:transposase